MLVLTLLQCQLIDSAQVEEEVQVFLVVMVIILARVPLMEVMVSYLTSLAT